MPGQLQIKVPHFGLDLGTYPGSKDDQFAIKFFELLEEKQLATVATRWYSSEYWEYETYSPSPRTGNPLGTYCGLSEIYFFIVHPNDKFRECWEEVERTNPQINRAG